MPSAPKCTANNAGWNDKAVQEIVRIPKTANNLGVDRTGKTLAGKPDTGSGVLLMRHRQKVALPMWGGVGTCVVIACITCLMLTLALFCVVLMW